MLRMDIKLAATVFGIVFLAEILDKTQLALLPYAAKSPQRLLAVFQGASTNTRGNGATMYPATVKSLPGCTASRLEMRHPGLEYPHHRAPSRRRPRFRERARAWRLWV